ncbi:MAG: SDR family NAD(P)-dependent oxidoreductase [Acidobacteriota bacterium]
MTANPSLPFDGHCVLVTGSTRGIGLGIARRLLADGAVVGLHGRDPETVERVAEELRHDNGGGHTVPLHADLDSPGAAKELVDAFVGASGRIDGLVNNAGAGRAQPFRGLKVDGWQQTFRLNLEAAMVASQAAYVRMRKQKSGGIVNMASIAAHGPGKWMGADYAASKAALVSMTQSLALEAARFGIRCNAVSPGFIETDMTADLPDAARAGLNIPLKRMGTPADVAAAVAFLLGPDAAYMTGQVLHVDGGLWMHR